jgi:hypothetical protein
MGRVALLTAVLYGWGDPAFNGQRPGLLERPLQDFHRVVNEATSDVRGTLIMLSDLRSLRYLHPLIAAL